MQQADKCISQGTFLALALLAEFSRIIKCHSWFQELFIKKSLSTHPVQPRQGGPRASYDIERQGLPLFSMSLHRATDGRQRVNPSDR